MQQNGKCINVKPHQKYFFKLISIIYKLFFAYGTFRADTTGISSAKRDLVTTSGGMRPMLGMPLNKDKTPWVRCFHGSPSGMSTDDPLEWQQRGGIIGIG